MKDIILEMLKSTRSLNSLSKKLAISKSQLREELNKLKKDGIIYIDSETGYIYALKEGKIIIKKQGFGFIETDDPNESDYYVNEYETLDSFDGDRVLFYSYESGGKLKSAKVVRVIKRAHEKIIGPLISKKYKNREKYYVVSHDPNFHIKVRIKESFLNNAKIGNVVIASIDYSRKFDLEGKVEEVLGYKDDPSIDITEIAARYGYHVDFSLDTILEIEKISNEVSESDLCNRKDFTNDLVITIDGDDSKDFDDAVSLTKLVNGNYLLKVYIADVSHYVKPKTPLDNDAYKRGTSVYLADRVIPMLPRKLSNGICSLNEGVIRLVMACIMEISPKGNLVDYEICEGYIKSTHRMTYNNVNKMIHGDKNVIESYSDIYNMILDMKILSNIIRDKRTKKGGLEFEVDEYKFTLNDEGEPIEFKLRTRDDAEKLIEDFMLMANETVAYHMNIMNVPCVYRVHEKPDQDKLRDVFTMIKNMGYKVKFNQNDIHPKQIQDALNEVEDTHNSVIVNQILLRAMMKAKYTTKNLGHYGLALQYYCHFTSPIRRYPDLMVHRLLKEFLLHPENMEDRFSYYEANLEQIAINNSVSERQSIECEREVDDMLMAWYMSKHINEEYDGLITSITSFGMFVTLDNGVEGLVALSDMQGYFYYDEKSNLLSSENRIFKLGDKVKVVVIRASKATRQVDLMTYKDFIYFFGAHILRE